MAFIVFGSEDVRGNLAKCLAQRHRHIEGYMPRELGSNPHFTRDTESGV
jgi:hypothetical protein